MPTVLVVDDTAVDRRIVGGLLEEAQTLDVKYAENGNDALQQMEQSLPDLIVTDLQMPEMDGLELVSRVRLQYPAVPVVLITSKGSEAIAVDALDLGASSYVPKSQLADKLSDTVSELLSLSSAGKTYSHLMSCQRQMQFSYELDNDDGLINALVDLVQQVVGGMQLTDHTGKFRVGVAVKEALLNALYRGNLEISFQAMEQSREELLTGEAVDLASQRRQQHPYSERKIFVEAAICRDEARFVIRDEGPGFDHRKYSADDSGRFDSLDAQGGRGLVLMRSFMDEVHFNEAGNEVTLVKRRDEFPASPELQG